jgi:hypothetical protein
LVQSIAVLLVGTGLALAQSPSTGAGPATPRSATARTDASYPQTSGQQSYATSLPTDPNGDADHFGGTTWGNDVEDPSRFFVSADYLLWRIRSPSLPPLTTSVPIGVVQIAQPIFVNGVAQKNTPIFSVPFTINNKPGLASQNSVDLGDHNGGRLTIGAWLDSERDFGVEASSFWLEKRTATFRATTTNVNNQFNLDTGVQSQFFITTPGALGAAQQLASTADVVVPGQGRSDLLGTLSSELWGGEVNFLCGGYCLGAVTFGGLIGIRYVNFEETFLAGNSVVVTDIPGSTQGADLGVLPISFKSVDYLRAKNNIVAPQIGLDFEARCYGFFFDARGKIAVGADFQSLNVFGVTSSSTPSGGTLTSLGGLLSGPSDQGTINKTRVMVLPEINLRLGYDLCSWMRIFAGYDALYMQHVIRTAQSVTFTNSTTQLQVAESSTQIGVRQAAINLRDLDVWVQGINFGLEFHY